MGLYRKVRLACPEGMSERAAAKHFGIARESVRKMLRCGFRTAGVSALEGEGEDFEGTFGGGEGKWRVTVSADRALHVLSLVRSRWGYLASLSP